MIVLGIETACDDTSAAIVEDGAQIRSNVIWSQSTVHERFGGVVPELAARRHVEVITRVIEEALDVAGISLSQVDLVGVNCSHGLLRSVIVGVAAAKSLAYSLGIPLVGVHHIEAHIYSNLLQYPELGFPHVCLTVSGGHNLLIHVMDHGKYEIIGRTADDSAGEAFDKVSKLLGLGFPGGRIIDDLAKHGDRNAYRFPRPMIASKDFNFSFSGLKTAVTNEVNSARRRGIEIRAADIVASFQQAVVEVLVSKSIRAAVSLGARTLTVAGGVSANSALRTQLQAAAKPCAINVLFPAMQLCVDNGAMVGALAYHKYRSGTTADLRLGATANAPLGLLNASYKIGQHGVAK